MITEKDWTDLNSNSSWNRGEPFVDLNGNGKFDAVWMAGFGEGRPGTSIHDATWVRAIALRYNNTTIVFATVDCIGYFKQEMDKIRARLPAALGIDILVMSATHVHETQDTIGIWGEDDSHSGLDPAYMERIRAQSVVAITAAVGSLEPANFTIGQIKLEEPAGDWRKWVYDARDPKIVDSTMSVMRFTRAGKALDAADATIATWVIWASHPEFAGSRNNAITADYVAKLRETVETGGAADEGLPALGGMAMFSNGPLGAQVGPGSANGDGVPVMRADGTRVMESSVERADLHGLGLGRWALRALKSGNGAETLMTAPLSFRTKELLADVDNYRYHTAFLIGLFDRELIEFDENQPITRPGNIPKVKAEITEVEIGPVAIATFPGELSPELYLGGYDGSHSATQPVVDVTAPNPPDVTMAPAGPYIRELLLARPGIKYAVGLGLAQDFLGYIMPSFDFELSADDPYFSEAPGDHYEETNSIGPLAEQQLIAPLRAMIAAP